MSQLVNTDYFTDMTNAVKSAKSCAELNAITADIMASLQAEMAAINAQTSAIWALGSIDLTSITNLGTAIAAIKLLISPYAMAYATYAAQFPAMAAQIAQLEAAIAAAAASFPTCGVPIPSLTLTLDKGAPGNGSSSGAFGGPGGVGSSPNALPGAGTFDPPPLVLGNDMPLPNGLASPGISGLAAREDHIHPDDVTLINLQAQVDAMGAAGVLTPAQMAVAQADYQTLLRDQAQIHSQAAAVGLASTIYATLDSDMTALGSYLSGIVNWGSATLSATIVTSVWDSTWNTAIGDMTTTNTAIQAAVAQYNTNPQYQVAAMGTQPTLTPSQMATAQSAYSSLVSQVATLEAQGSNAGMSSSTWATMSADLGALNTYLTGITNWGSLTLNATIVPATWQAKWGAVYTDIAAFTTSLDNAIASSVASIQTSILTLGAGTSLTNTQAAIAVADYNSLLTDVIALNTQATAMTGAVPPPSNASTITAAVTTLGTSSSTGVMGSLTTYLTGLWSGASPSLTFPALPATGNAIPINSSWGATWQAVFTDIAVLENAMNVGVVTSISTALNTLINIGNDGILSVSEKPTVINDYTVLKAEALALDAQATQLSVDHTAYDSAVAAVVAVIAALTSTSPATDALTGELELNYLGSDSVIASIPNWNSAWTGYEAAKTAIMLALARAGVPSVAYVATSNQNLTTNASLTIDGHSFAPGDSGSLIMLMGQSTSSQDGVWVLQYTTTGAGSVTLWPNTSSATYSAGLTNAGNMYDPADPTFATYGSIVAQAPPGSGGVRSNTVTISGFTGSAAAGSLNINFVAGSINGTGTENVTISYSTNGGSTWSPFGPGNHGVPGQYADMAKATVSQALPSVTPSSIQVQITVFHSIYKFADYFETGSSANVYGVQFVTTATGTNNYAFTNQTVVPDKTEWNVTGGTSYGGRQWIAAVTAGDITSLTLVPGAGTSPIATATIVGLVKPSTGLSVDSSGNLSVSGTGGAAWGSITGSSAQAAPAGGWTGALALSGVGTLPGSSWGGIYKTATGGFILAASAGSTNDFMMVTPTGSLAIMTVPTGTNNMVFGGSVSMGALTANGVGTFQPTVAAGTYGLKTSGASGAARDIFIAGQSGYSNGFTVQFDGAKMLYGLGDPTGITTISGSVSMGALTATGGTFNNGVYVGGYAGNPYGSIFKQPTNGLALAGTTGSVNDFAILTPAAAVIAYNPTGTLNMAFNGSVSMGALAAGFTTVSTASSPSWGILRVNNPSAGGEASMSFSNNNSGPGAAGSTPSGNAWAVGLGVGGISPNFGVYNLATNSVAFKLDNTAGYIYNSLILTLGNVGTNAATLQAAVASATAPKVGTNAQMWSYSGAGVPSGFYPYWYATDSTNTNDGTLGALYQWNGSTWVYQNQPQVLTPKVTAGVISAGAVGAQAIAADVALIGQTLRNTGFTAGTSSVAPSGFKFSGTVFTATLLDGTTLSVFGELGADLSIGGLKAAVIANRVKGNLFYRNTAGTTDVFVPDGVVSIEVTLQATGGNGASSYGTGGAGGQYIKAMVTVKPHNTYRLTLGAAGSNSTFSWVSFDGTSGFTTDSSAVNFSAACGAAGSGGSGTGAQGADIGFSFPGPESSWNIGGAAGGDNLAAGAISTAGRGGNIYGLGSGGSGGGTTATKQGGGGGGASATGNGGGGGTNPANGQPGTSGGGGGGGSTGGAGGVGFVRAKW